MSISGDDELLGSENESDYDDFEISHEKEEALLQDDEEYSKSRDGFDDYKKDSLSEDEQDILNLDVEEDLPDVESEIQVSKPETKPISKSPVKEFQATSSQSVSSQKSSNVPANLTRKTIPHNERRWRGSGRGNFKGRPNFRNNQHKRSGTVLINPRYEGTVQVNEHSARLAWDNSQYPQNNMKIQPWASTNYEVNAPNQLLKNILVQSGNLLIPPLQQPTSPNFYEPPPNYERPLSFEPPPNIQDQAPQTTYGQVSNPSALPYPPRRLQHPFNNQAPNNGDRFNRQNYNLQSKKNYTYARRAPNNNNNYPPQNNNQNKNMFYVGNDDYENIYSDYGFEQGNSYHSNYQSKMNPKDFSQTQTGENTNLNYTQKFPSNQNAGTFGFNTNNYNRPNQYKKPFYNKDTACNPNQSFNKERVRPSDVVQNESAEKRIRVETSTASNTDTMKVKSEQSVPTTSDAVNEEEENEEIRLYRLKIEEQKKERERVLRIKEERRKQIMMERRKKDEQKLITHNNQQFSNEDAIENSTSIQKPIKLEHSVETEQTQFFTVSVPRPIQQDSGFRQNRNQHFPPSGGVTTKNSFQKSNRLAPSSFVDPPPQIISSNISGFDSSGDLENFTFKVSNNKINLPDTVQSPVPKTEASSSGFMSNRVVIVKHKNNANSGEINNSQSSIAPINNEVSGQELSSFFNNRKVLKKDNSLLNTRLVVVNNLSATINQSKLVALTRGIGEIQTIRVDKQERQATILFKCVASAHAFFKKYRRRILDDLSVIEVKLEPLI